MILYLPSLLYFIGFFILAINSPNTWQAFLSVLLGGMIIYFAGVVRGMIEAAKRMQQ